MSFSYGGGSTRTPGVPLLSSGSYSAYGTGPWDEGEILKPAPMLRVSTPGARTVRCAVS